MLNPTASHAALAFALATVLAAPVAGAASLDGTPVRIEWLMPDRDTVVASLDVVVGPDYELFCLGGGGLCDLFGPNVAAAGFNLGGQRIDFGAMVPFGVLPAAFNGIRFSGLDAGGSWTQATLIDTNVPGLDASRLSFDGATLEFNLQGVQFPEFGFWTVGLTPAVPEPGAALLFAAGLAGLMLRRTRAAEE